MCAVLNAAQLTGVGMGIWTRTQQSQQRKASTRTACSQDRRDQGARGRARHESNTQSRRLRAHLDPPAPPAIAPPAIPRAIASNSPTSNTQSRRLRAHLDPPAPPAVVASHTRTQPCPLHLVARHGAKVKHLCTEHEWVGREEEVLDEQMGKGGGLKRTSFPGWLHGLEPRSAGKMPPQLGAPPAPSTAGTLTLLVVAGSQPSCVMFYFFPISHHGRRAHPLGRGQPAVAPHLDAHVVGDAQWAHALVVGQVRLRA